VGGLDRRSRRLPGIARSLCHRSVITAEALVKEGRAEAVKRYLDRIAVGGFA
jgi:hypothetical protein